LAAGGLRGGGATVVGDLVDPRRKEPATDLEGRALLEAWLEFHRTTLLLKCEGLEDEGRRRRPVASSKLSLHGLVRHMAEVERYWFGDVLGGQPDAPPVWPESAADDGEFEVPPQASFEDDVATWQAQCAASRATAGTRALEDAGLRQDGSRCTLWWIYLHMIEEYARHNGHADILRELVDGAVGC
jgi:uncharacterized damage-inducible protein DinB